MIDAWSTRAALGLRRTVLAALSHEEFRTMLAEVHSVGPAPRSAEAARNRTGGAWRQPGRGAYTRQAEESKEEAPAAPSDRRPESPHTYESKESLHSHDGQVSRLGPRIDTQGVSMDGKSAIERYLERQRCPESVGGHRPGRDGRCEWCSRRVAGAMPEPDLGPHYRTRLGDSYRYHYEPDWGSDRHDS